MQWFSCFLRFTYFYNICVLLILKQCKSCSSYKEGCHITVKFIPFAKTVWQMVWFASRYRPSSFLSGCQIVYPENINRIVYIPKVVKITLR